MRKTTKLLALCMAFIMMLSSFGMAASAASFPDVEASYEYSEAIDLLASLNILGGYEDGTFKPENNITRAEFAKVIYVIFNGMDDVNAQMYISESQFDDVAKNQWFNGHVNWASTNAIVGGYGDGTFLPNNNVSLKEAVKMVVTAVTDKTLAYPNGYIQEAKALKLLNDVQVKSMDAPATRGQVAQLAYNLLFTSSRLCLIDTGTMDFYGNEIYKKTPPVEFVFDLTPVKNVTLQATYENAFMSGVTTLEEGEIQLSTGKFEFNGDANDLFGQTLTAYMDADNELAALVSTSDVTAVTTVDKLVGDGSTRYPYETKVGEYITIDNTKDYVLKNVYVQGSNGHYSKLTADDTVNGVDYVRLSSICEDEYNNNKGKVTFIDNDLDGSEDTAIIEYQGVGQVTKYASSSRQIRFNGASLSFDKVNGYEAFANKDYSTDADPVYATYTIAYGSEGTVYTLEDTTTSEGVLTSVNSVGDKVVVGGKTYSAFGTAQSGLFEGYRGNIGDTVKLYQSADGYVVGIVVTDSNTVYDLNLAKVIDASDEADRYGNNIEATITIVTPTGKELMYKIDTTYDLSLGDDVQCVFEGTAANWVENSDDSEIFFDYTVDSDLSDGNDSDYTIVGKYIHYELDENTDEIIRVVAINDLARYEPTGSTKTWAVESYSDNLCYSDERAFYTSSDSKGETVSGIIGVPSDSFVGMYYEENEDGDLETAYYTANNIPEFANKGNFLLVWSDDDLVAMVVTKTPEAIDDNKVLGIITDFATVEGEAKKNGKLTYRTEISMLVDGEVQKFYTEDFLANNLPVTDFDAETLTGLTENQLVYLQLQTDGKVKVNNKAIDVDYVEYDELTFAVATAVRSSYITSKEVTSFTNPVISGWTTDKNGQPVYNEEGKDGEITFGNSATLRVCDETTFITIAGTPDDIAENATIFQETASADLTAGGQIMKSNEKTNEWNVFAYTVFGSGEADDSDNDGALKVVYVFETSLDAVEKVGA